MKPNFEEILKKHRMKNAKCYAIEAMKEVWNMAIEEAAENAEEKYSDSKSYDTILEMEYYEIIGVDKESILKLKL